jgi:hypothetical protein
MSSKEEVKSSRVFNYHLEPYGDLNKVIGIVGTPERKEFCYTQYVNGVCVLKCSYNLLDGSVESVVSAIPGVYASTRDTDRFDKGFPDAVIKVLCHSLPKMEKKDWGKVLTLVENLKHGSKMLTALALACRGILMKVAKPVVVKTFNDATGLVMGDARKLLAKLYKM